MNLLERNLEALARRDAELARILERCATDESIEPRQARSGAWSLCVDGRLEASLEDPEADGERIARHFRTRVDATGARRLVVFGLGVHTLRHLAGAAPETLVIEPSAAFARAVLERVDLSDVLPSIELVISDRPERALSHRLFSARQRGVFVAHATTRRRFAALHDALATRFHAGGDPEPLDIAVIPPLYGGSLPVAQAAARALRELGHRVRDIDLSPFWPAYRELLRQGSDLRLSRRSEELRAGLVRLIGEALLTQFWADPPDVIFALAQAPLDAVTLERLRERGVVRAFWFCEDAHVMPYWKDSCTSYDVFFHVQPELLGPALRERGAFGAALPMAFDPKVHRPIELTREERARYGCDLSFVGAAYHNRVEMLPGLVDLGLRIYGTGWPAVPPFTSCSPALNRRLSPEESNLVFNASAINLNLHSSPWTDGVNPVGDYLNPRCFELAGAGTFQLVDRRSDLAAAFEPGVEVETFADLAECRAKVRHYLARPDERREIAERGRKRALAEHTYRHRMERAIEILRSAPVPALARRSATPTIRQAIGAMQEEAPAVAEILRRLPPERRLDGDALYLAVAAGQGELSREEKILLFMREAMTEIQILNAAGDPA